MADVIQSWALSTLDGIPAEVALLSDARIYVRVEGRSYPIDPDVLSAVWAEAARALVTYRASQCPVTMTLGDSEVLRCGRMMNHAQPTHADPRGFLWIPRGQDGG